MVGRGIKTQASDRKVTTKFLDDHLLIGMETMKDLVEKKLVVKHLRFD
jgi:AMP nucleosidase